MDSLPYETLFNILIYLSYREIINICLTNKYCYTISQDDTFWTLKANFDFRVTRKQFGDSKLKGKGCYLKFLVTKGLIFIPGMERIIDINLCLKLASDQNNLKLVDYFLNQGATNIYLVFLRAAKYGHLDMMHYVVPKLPNIIPARILKEALYLASSRQHQQIIDYVINLGLNIGKKKRSYQFPTIHQLYEALILVAKTGNVELFDHIIFFINGYCNNGYDDILYDISLSKSLFNCSSHNHKDLVIHILNQTKGRENYFITALKGAAYGGYKGLIDQLLILCPSIKNEKQLNVILSSALKGNQIDIINYLFTLGANH